MPYVSEQKKKYISVKAEIILVDTAIKSSPMQFVLLNKNYY
jgi:hypothetical protein